MKSDAARPRRHRTRQRARLLALLRSREDHPTAAELYQAAQPEFPNLSLGTVYRNLDVLVSEGQVETIPCAGGATRYDGNQEPHHHFICERCGNILDVKVSLPDELRRSLARKYRLRAERAHVRFFGLCDICSDRTIPPNE